MEGYTWLPAKGLDQKRGTIRFCAAEYLLFSVQRYTDSIDRNVHDESSQLKQSHLIWGE